MGTPTFTKTGTKASVPAKLPKEIFALEVKHHELIKEAYVTYLSNGRLNLAVTLKRGEVSGGGKKPWRQKGTGRARFGSSRNPIWKGGGVAFGPTGNENYVKKMSPASKNQAVRQALSLKSAANAVTVIEELNTKDGKVKPMVALLEKLGVTRNVLVVVNILDPMTIRATKNIPNVKLVRADRLNTFDVMNADTILFTNSSIDMVNAWLGAKK